MKRCKKLMAILLAFAMCITSGGAYVQSYASEADESSDAIQISSATELAKIGKESGYPLDGSYVLTCDIDMKDYGDWTPIGYVENDPDKNNNIGAFAGTFDGQNHTIRNMKVRIASGCFVAGLFGQIYSTGTIKNLRIADSKVWGHSGSKVYAGILFGYAKGESTTERFQVQNVSIENCYSYVESDNRFNPIMSGGLAGFASQVNISDVYVGANVEAKYVGKQQGTETEQIGAGGILGMTWSNTVNITRVVFNGSLDTTYYVQNSENSFEPSVSARRNPVFSYQSSANVTSANFKQCYYNSNICQNVTTPLTKGYFNGTAMTMDELKSALSSTHMDGSDLWYNDATDGLKLKIGREFDATDFVGYTVLWDADDLKKKINDNLSGNYVLAQDVNMAGVENWTPIGAYNVNAQTAGGNEYTNNFSGTFDGNGKKISNMNIDLSGSYVNAGFFGTVKNAVIKNVGFENCRVVAQVSNRGFVAVVVGSAWDKAVTVENTFVKNSFVHIKTTNKDQNAAAASFVGVAAPATLKNCWSDTDVKAEYTGSTVGESVQIGAGGFVGTSYKKVSVENSVFVGTLDASKFYSESYSYNVNNQRQNTIIAFNNQDIYNNAGWQWQTQYVKNCYYLPKANTVGKQNVRGLDGTALTTVDFGIRSVETLGLDSNYWIHTGNEPVLKISGETAWDGTPDVNGDGEVDICDLVRNKVFADDNTVEHVLYRATNMAESTDEDKITVNANDITEMRKYLLGMVEMKLNQTTAGQFKVLGNTVANAQEFYMDHSYTGFAFRAYAEGDVTVQFEYAPQNGFSYAKLAVVVDGNVEGRKVISISKSGTYTIATVEPGEHTFEVIKLTERNHDILKAKQISLKGMLKAAPEDATYKIQFIGDSITAASALTSYTKGDLNAEQAAQDIMQGYAYKTASELNADLSVRARSGIKTAIAATALLPNDQSDQYDVVVIGLGTNDNTENDTEKQAQLKNDVTTMLTNARKAYPNAKIVWIYGMMITVDNATIKEAVTEFAKEDANVFYFDGFTANQQGGAGHPNAEAHSAAGTALANYIKTEVLKSTN